MRKKRREGVRWCSYLPGQHRCVWCGRARYEGTFRQGCVWWLRHRPKGVGYRTASVRLR